MSSLKLAFQELASALKVKWLRLSYQKSRKKGWIVQHMPELRPPPIFYMAHIYIFIYHTEG